MAVPASDRQGAIAALVVGDDSGLSRGDWQVLQDTGTVHLMVISGQHIGMLAGCSMVWSHCWLAWVRGRGGCAGCPGRAGWR